jgi:hypothetical protein
MPSSDQARRTLPLSIARTSGGGDRPPCDVTRAAAGDDLPMQATSRAIHKYDNRVVPFPIAAGATGIGAPHPLQESDEIGPFLTASVRIKVNSYDRRARSPCYLWEH